MKPITYMMLIAAVVNAQTGTTNTTTPATPPTPVTPTPPPPPPSFTTSTCFECASKKTNKFCSPSTFNIAEPSYAGYCCTPGATDHECHSTDIQKCSEAPEKSEA